MKSKSYQSEKMKKSNNNKNSSKESKIQQNATDKSGLIKILTNSSILFMRYYTTTTPQKLMIVDTFLIYLSFLMISQCLYALFISSYPQNAFLASLMASLGTFVLTTNLRFQMSNTSVFKSTTEKIIVDYLACVMVLFLGVFSLIG